MPRVPVIILRKPATFSEISTKSTFIGAGEHFEDQIFHRRNDIHPQVLRNTPCE
jgi:hypothetical protein